MTVQILDIVDTGIKIGLGALISGITTYCVSNLNHSHDSSKDLKKRKLDVLESVTEHTYEYINEFKNLLSVVDGVRRNIGDLPDISLLEIKHERSLMFISKYDEKFCDARDHLEHAISKLYLIGLGNMVEYYPEFKKLEMELRQSVMFDCKLPNMDYISDLRNRFHELSNKFFYELGKNYQAK